MRAKNYYVYGEKSYLEDVAEQYISLGRDVQIEKDRIVVFARPRPKLKPKKETDEERRKSKRERDYGQARA